MQQPRSITELNTAPRPTSVTGQFEDAADDHEKDEKEEVQISAPGKSLPSAGKSSHPLKQPSVPPPSMLQRRISTNTTEATKALLAFAAGAGTAPARKNKKKTFVVRLEEIKEYNERHGRVPRRDPVESDEPWEQNLLAWVQDCRKQFVEGTFSQEKANALHDLGMEGFRMPSMETTTIRPQANTHPALRALWLKRQQEEARLMQLRRVSMGMLGAAPTTRRLDPDGTTIEEVYPAESLMPRRSSLGTELQLQEASQRMALEEMHARETLAREALMREQIMLREQRIAQAMVAQRRLSLGAYGGGLTQQGRVMSLLQPLESVPPRADINARMNALLQARMMQERRASFNNLLRRPSDASSTVMERRPSGLGSLSLEPPQQPPPPQQPARTRKTWDERMQEMWDFFLTNGHTQVQTRGQHRELGRWLSSTRCRLRDGLLPQHLVKEFLAMEGWTVEDGQHVKNATGLVGLTTRRDSVPSSGTVPEVILQTPPTQSKVKTLGPTPPSKTKSKRALPKSWHQSFTELQHFKAKFGHCDVKMIVSSPYGMLGKWLASQRSRHKLGQLPIDKVDRLREIGCNGFAEGGKVPRRSQYRADDEEAEFDQALRQLKPGEGIDPTSPPCSPDTREKRVRHSYETRVEHIKAFKAKHGHCKIRLGSTDKHEELLARWLASARSRYRGGQFKEERADELRALGCDGFDAVFDEVEGDDPSTDMEEEAEYGSRKRDAPTRTATPSPTHSMGEEEEEGSEPASKKHRLRGQVKRQSFDDMLKEMESYQYIFGVGCSVPKPDGEKGKLGRWLAFQRRQFIAGKLSKERIAKLRAIGRKEFHDSALIVRMAERTAASVYMHQ